MKKKDYSKYLNRVSEATGMVCVQARLEETSYFWYVPAAVISTPELLLQYVYEDIDFMAQDKYGQHVFDLSIDKPRHKDGFTQKEYEDFLEYCKTKRGTKFAKETTEQGLVQDFCYKYAYVIFRNVRTKNHSVSVPINDFE